MKNVIEFKRVNLCEDSKYPLYVYDAQPAPEAVCEDILEEIKNSHFEDRGHKYRGIRIIKTKKHYKPWSIMVIRPGELEFEFYMDGFKSMKEACMEANTFLNPNFRFDKDGGYEEAAKFYGVW